MLSCQTCFGSVPAAESPHFFSWYGMPPPEHDSTAGDVAGTLRRLLCSDGTSPPISEGTIPPTHPSTLYYIMWKCKTNPEAKTKLSTPEQATAGTSSTFLHRAPTAPNIERHLSVMSTLGIAFLVLKFAFNIIDHVILFYDLEHVCQHRFLVLQCPKSQRKVTVMSPGRSHALWLVWCIKVH